LENQKYCRKCGLPLTNVQLVLSGDMEEITEKFKKGEGILVGGAITLLIFAFVAILNIFLNSERSISGAVNLILGIFITAPMIFIGIKRLERAKKLIEGGAKAEAITAKPVKELPTAPTTDRSLSLSQTPPSVTEHTTYGLSQPEDNPTRKMQSE
jgi:hypothetical protein